MDPFPTFNRAFAKVSQEVRHQSIFRFRDNKSKVLSFSVQAASVPTQVAPKFSPNLNPTPPIMLCDYCGKQGHTIDICYQKHGHPPSGTRGCGRGGGHGRSRGGGHKPTHTVAAAESSTQISSSPSTSRLTLDQV